MPTMSVRDFFQRLQSEIEEECNDNGWDSSLANHKGTAFGLWCARLIADLDPRFDTDPIDAHVDGPGDLGVDLVFSSTISRETLIAQCKFYGQNTILDEGHVAAFLTLHERLVDPEFVEKHGQMALRDALPLDTLRDHPEQVTYRLITNARVNDRTRAVWETAVPSDSVAAFELWSRDDLKQYYSEVGSRSADVPEEVTLELPSGQ